MEYNKHGALPGLLVQIENAAGASNTNCLHTYTNCNDLRTGRDVGRVPRDIVILSQFAQLALAVLTAHKSGTSDFTVCKYGLTHWCPNHAEPQHFAIQLGVS